MGLQQYEQEEVQTDVQAESKSHHQRIIVAIPRLRRSQFHLFKLQSELADVGLAHLDVVHMHASGRGSREVLGLD